MSDSPLAPPMTGQVPPAVPTAPAVPPLPPLPPPGSFPPVGPPPWSSAPAASQDSFFARVWPGKHSSRGAWVTALKALAWLFIPLFFALGIVAYFQVVDLTRSLSSLTGGFFTQGTPNVGLAILAMLVCWVVGAATSILMMVFAQMASDVGELKASTQPRDQRT